MGAYKSISEFFGKLTLSAKSVVKLAVESRRCGISTVDDPDRPLVIMGNGPSLADTMRQYPDVLHRLPTMAVNFAANADEFYQFKPDYYVLADPAFFADEPYENVVTLWENITGRIDWPMVLYVPVKYVSKIKQSLGDGSLIRVEGFNMVGVEGFDWLENAAFRSGRGMARPRNVLIVALMVAMKMGFRTIYITGADHSWTRTLEVSEENLVVTVQPHFYKDNQAEHARVASVYKDIRLHQILHSFYVAFKAYFSIRRYADSHGIRIYNATPGSFIDAFERRSLPE
ncbi:MAG: DUF115 domain-containing protein [Bacteroides sp.]|nr:DUF115 domain-containing protein [Bacteroides sp.]MCM1414269.1 DUF115 domain-containing protein [Bacteroides sp.]MCM1470983.1 DUF115 domain-containing protein [Bacteroides sp.]